MGGNILQLVAGFGDFRRNPHLEKIKRFTKSFKVCYFIEFALRQVDGSIGESDNYQRGMDFKKRLVGWFASF
jgi:hypothetical protein